MRILQVIPYFHPAHVFGGPVKVSYQISRELAKRKNEVTVYTSDAIDASSRLRTYSSRMVDGIRVYYFRNLALMTVKKCNLFITPQLVPHAMSEVKRFDVIHLHEYTTFQNIVVAHYARKQGIPYVLQVHGSLSGSAGRQMLEDLYDVSFGRRLLRDASKVIALSSVEALQYKQAGVSEKRIAVIPNGVDLSDYERPPPTGSFKARLGIDAGRKMILYLGRISKSKGIDFLVKAYAKLFEKKSADNSVLVIAGPDEGFLRKVKSLINELGLRDQAVLTGRLSEKEKVSVYVDSAIVVNVEPRNVFGLVPLEAAACSRPVIVSSGNAISAAVIDGGFGFSVDYGNVGELSEVIARMLSDDHLTAEMGRKGRQYVSRNFDWVTIVNEIERVYEEVANLHNWRS